MKVNCKVELAQLNHLSDSLGTRLDALGAPKGGIGLRGPGETQRKPIDACYRCVSGSSKPSLIRLNKPAQGRAKRQKSSVPTISLVGYTNAGKSTLFNTRPMKTSMPPISYLRRLTRTLRSVSWSGVGKVVLVDTVGFVRHLPHELRSLPCHARRNRRRQICCCMSLIVIVKTCMSKSPRYNPC